MKEEDQRRHGSIRRMSYIPREDGRLLHKFQNHVTWEKASSTSASKHLLYAKQGNKARSAITQFTVLPPRLRCHRSLLGPPLARHETRTNETKLRVHNPFGLQKRPSRREKEKKKIARIDIRPPPLPPHALSCLAHPTGSSFFE